MKEPLTYDELIESFVSIRDKTLFEVQRVFTDHGYEVSPESEKISHAIADAIMNMFWSYIKDTECAENEHERSVRTAGNADS